MKEIKWKKKKRVRIRLSALDIFKESSLITTSKYTKAMAEIFLKLTRKGFIFFIWSRRMTKNSEYDIPLLISPVTKVFYLHCIFKFQRKERFCGCRNLLTERSCRLPANWANLSKPIHLRVKWFNGIWQSFNRYVAAVRQQLTAVGYRQSPVKLLSRSVVNGTMQWFT